MRHVHPLVMLLVCLVSCARRAPGPGYAAEVRGAHQIADSAQSPEQKARAKEALEHAFERTGEPGAAAGVRQDLADRVARLELELGQPDEAVRWTQRGLSIEGAPSVLRANLLITEADAWTAQGRRGEARQALLSALEINQALLNVELESP